MEKRIELEKRGKDPKMITDLSLDNCRSPNIVGLTDEFENLEILSLNNVGLTSLKGFPELPNLKKLELSENRISNGLHVLLSSPKLAELNLSGNKIKELTSLEPLKELKNLKKLDLTNNEIIVLEYYRAKVFGLLPQLEYLDGFDRDEEPASDCEADGEKLNGNDEAGEEVDEEDGEEDDGNEEDEDEDEEAEDEDEDDIGLETVYKDNLDEESEGEDYEGEGEEFDEDEDIEDEESENDAEDDKTEGSVRGTKRKHEDEGE